jgi:mRNA-degrading endonuclease toxin of MazEF toxin-antitoxin module
MTVSRDRLAERIGRLSETDLARVDEALRKVLGL